MAQDTTPAIVVYQGDGSNTTFSVPFDKGYYGEVKVLFVRRGLSDYTYEPDTYTVNGRLYAWVNSGTYVYTHTPNPAVGAHTYDSTDVEQANDVSAIAGQTITVDGVIYARAAQHDIANQLLLTWTGTMLEVGDYICIARETERGQPYTLPNNQKHIEAALDNLERQVQEVAKKADNALLVDPAWMDVADGGAEDTSKMDPINWLKSIIRCIDFSVRAVRYANGWLDYSLDDPNIADGDKTWTHLLNTDNIKAIRERSDIVDGVTIYWTEYQASDGTWRTLANTSEWEARIDYAVATAEEAKETAEDAKGVADDAKEIADTFDGRLTQAETDASDAKNAATNAVNAVNGHIADHNNPHQVTKTQVGLGNCDNTSDLNKPISTATQNALDLKLPTSTKYGASFSLTINSSTYVVTAQLKDQDGNNLGSAQTIDLPLESVVVSGSYDSDNKKIVLTLQDGSTIDIPVGDLISGLQTEITNDNKLDADLVDDSTSTNKFVTATDKSTWSGKQDAITGAATSITTNNLANARAVISDANGKIAASTTTSTEIGYLSGTTSKIQTQINNKQDTLTAGSNITITGSTISATNTTYTGSDGITLTGTNFTNSGVRSVATGTTNGTISVNTNGTSADVAVKGLGSAAYTASSDYATAAQGALADSAVQPGDLATYVTTNTTQTISGEKTFSGIMNYSAGKTYILAGNGGTKLGYWSYDVDGGSNITLQTMTASTRDINFKTNNGGKVKYNNSEIAKVSDIPTTVSALTNDSGFITSADIPVTDVTVGGTSVVSSGTAAIPTIPTTLAALTGDVDITTPTDGQHLVYDADDQKWKNTTSAASVSWGGITGTLSDQTDLNNALNAVVPVGIVFPFAGLTTPNGYLVCDGSAVSRTTYADLFNTIGTYYGDGDGSTTFNLPNFMNGYPLSNGSSSDISNGYVTASASLPNITGNFNAYTYNMGNPSGAFGASIQTAKVLNSGSQNNLNINTFSFSAQASSGRYSRTDGLVYPTRNILRGGWIIKY